MEKKVLKAPPVLFAIGVLCGIFIGVPLLLLSWERVVNSIEELAAVIASTIAVLILIILIAVVFKKQINRKLLNGAKGRIEDVIEEFSDLVGAVVKKEPELAIAASKNIVLEGVAWILWGRFFQWIIATILGLTLAFGAIAGTVLLVKQNAILGEQQESLKLQTKLLSEQVLSTQQQTALMQEQREVSVKQNQLVDLQIREAIATREVQIFVAQIDRLLSAIDNTSLLESSGTPCELSKGDTQCARLDKQVFAKIQAASSSFTPYITKNIDGRELKFSPEKGRLYSTLRAVDFPFAQIMSTGKGLDFSSAILPGLAILNEDLGEIDFSHADLTQVGFSGSNLSRFILEGALLPGTEKMKRTNLMKAKLANAVVPTLDWITELSHEQVDILGESGNPYSPIGSETTQYIDTELWYVEKGQVEGINFIRKDESVEMLHQLLSEIEYDDNDNIPDEYRVEQLASMSSLTPLRELNSGESCLSGHYFEPQVKRSIMRGKLLGLAYEWDLPVDEIIAKAGTFKGACVDKSHCLDGLCQFQSNMDNINFEDASLVHVSFVGASLKSANFRGTNLPAAEHFKDAALTNIDLEGALVPDENWLLELHTKAKNFAAGKWEIETFPAIILYREEDGAPVDHLNGYRVIRK